MSTLEEGVRRDARNVYNNIIISNSTIISIIPPQINKMSAWYKVVCGRECCISAKSIHSSFLSWHGSYLNKLKDLIQNSRNRRSDEMDNSLFETYKIQECRMEVIYMQNHHTRPWLQCMHIHHHKMHCHNEKFCCVVVLIAHVFIFRANNQIGIILTHLLQCVCIFIT